MTIPRWHLICSTGTFTRDPDQTDYETILQLGPLLNVDGLEVLFYPDWYRSSDAISASLAASGLSFPVLHTEKSIGPLLGRPHHADRSLALERLAVNCQFAQAIGAHTVVLHLWGWPESDDAIERNLSALDQCCTIADRYGVVLAIETIPCRQADPLTHIRHVIEHHPRCRVALDTEFLALHEQLEVAVADDWLWHTNAVQHIHIKDYDGHMLGQDSARRYLHPGEGWIDFDRFFAALSQRQFTGTVSLEASAIAADGAVNVARLQRSLAMLRQFGQQ